jgi:hypothetical protein
MTRARLDDLFDAIADLVGPDFDRAAAMARVAPLWNLRLLDGQAAALNDMRHEIDPAWPTPPPGRTELREAVEEALTTLAAAVDDLQAERLAAAPGSNVIPLRG